LGVVNIPKKPILADPNMIDTVLRNLIQNAIKFTSQGGGVIVSAHIDHEWMWVQITDTGIGISKERIKNIFKIDTTLSTLGTKGEVGSGLGLHVCNELVQKFGGKMEVISQEGNGATFKFSIPLA
jgi:two-component system sensor histidine kinase/response regulator